MNILGIETSCDETAAAIVENGVHIKSNVIYSQISKHRPYGGVVPEIASRNHVEKLPYIIKQALNDAELKYEELDAIAVTYGPGLASSLLVGFSSAKALSKRLSIPLVGVNHHAGHLHSVFMSNDIPRMESAFPMLALMVSGGDTSLIIVEDIGKYNIIGSTIDDAAGEALDKAATVLKLGYPGGPVIQKAAENGQANKINFPRGLEQPSRSKWIYQYNRDFCFSFSGLKTSLINHMNKYNEFPDESSVSDIAASYQEAVVDALLLRVNRALDFFKVNSFACAGGVSLNKTLRNKLNDLSIQKKIPLLLSPPSLCTDNAAMIAGVAYEQLMNTKEISDPVDVCPSLRLANW